MKTLRIVAAANRWPDGVIVVGVRHADRIMASVARIAPHRSLHHTEEGFVDSRGDFHSREAAWVIAYAANQILHRLPADTKTDGTHVLWSENLY